MRNMAKKYGKERGLKKVIFEKRGRKEVTRANTDSKCEKYGKKYEKYGKERGLKKVIFEKVGRK